MGRLLMDLFLSMHLNTLYLLPCIHMTITFLDLPHWRRFRTLAKRQKNLFRLANLAKVQNFSTQAKYKYGYKILREFKHAVEIDDCNGNTKWQDDTKLELATMEA